MSEGHPQENEAAAPFRRIARSLFGIVECRIQLFASEMQAERVRFINTLFKFAVAISVGTVALLLGTFTLALYVWQIARYAGLIVMTSLFAMAAGFLLWRLKLHMRQSPAPFTRTIGEFKKDRQCLMTKD